MKSSSKRTTRDNSHKSHKSSPKKPSLSRILRETTQLAIQDLQTKRPARSTRSVYRQTISLLQEDESPEQSSSDELLLQTLYDSPNAQPDLSMLESLNPGRSVQGAVLNLVFRTILTELSPTSAFASTNFGVACKRDQQNLEFEWYKRPR